MVALRGGEVKVSSEWWSISISIIFSAYSLVAKLS